VHHNRELYNHTINFSGSAAPHPIYLINNKTHEISDILVESDEQPSNVHERQVSKYISAAKDLNGNDRQEIQVGYFK
jgi:hypothetical protein